MNVDRPSALLGGLSPAAFMRRHWQKKPLLVRQALAGEEASAMLSRDEVFALAARDDVRSRLVQREGARWSVRHGPLPRRAMPGVTRPGWTLLVQGVDLHLRAARALLDAFRFVPDVRLDDLMVSWASDGGGVGPHLDSYDVFLLQLQGRRRWRIGPAADRSFRAGLPLKILRRFEPDEEWLLEPGDMLYLPPGHAHDGVAVGGGCLTASIGFRAPDDATLAGEVLQRLADPDDEGVLYADPRQPATRKPGAIPDGLTYFATRAVLSRMAKGGFERAVGEVLSEPGAQVWFAAGTPLRAGAGVAVAAATRLLYDRRHVFINGESFVASGTDQRLLQKLADKRRLSGQDVARFSDAAREWVGAWHEQGWLTPERPDMTDTPERRP